MRGGISLGRIFGINVRLDWSWLLIFFLVTWNLANVFGDLQPDWNNALNWLLAVVAALLFFGSVLAHELAHSVVARARGIPVRNIVLFLFGGVSNIERDPDSPKSEFLITVVGPLTSFALGIIFLLLARAIAGAVDASVDDPEGMVRAMGPTAVMLYWLGSVNILLGAFNLIPGFPLDGGRILRSILWAATNNLRKATEWASYVGQIIAWLLIIGGISMVFGAEIPFFGTGLIGGLWLAFIGWFLNSASVQSYQHIVIQDVLEDVPVTRMMRANPPTVPSEISLSTLVYDHMMGTSDHAFPVVDGGTRLVGMVTLEDVRKVPRTEWDTTLTRDIMTPASDLSSTTPDADAIDVWNKLQQRDVAQIPVMQGDRLVGLVRRTDIVRWLQLTSELSTG